MSAQTTLTCCPGCDTRFRVTAAQLQVAGGKVRCGNCMNIFNALQHRADTPASVRTTDTGKSIAPAVPTKSATTPTTTISVPAQPTTAITKAADELEDTFHIDDDMLFQDDPETDATEEGYAGVGKRFDNSELSDSFLALDENAPEKAPPDDEPTESFDESWAESMLLDEVHPAKSAARPAIKPSTPPYPPQRPAQPPMELGLVETDEHRVSSPMVRLSAQTPSAQTPDHSAAARPLAESPMHASDSYRSARAPTPYDNLRATPIAVNARPGGWLHNTVWSLLTLLLLGLVTWQIFWFQFDKLAHLEPMRPFYEMTCPYIGCTLPVMSAPERIESRKLVVRNHPLQQRTLLVEATIINQASFAQPFPGIALTFSNLNQDVIAQRVFRPEDYLQGDAARMPLMPPSTPFNIGLSLKDPGREAVNWSLRFMPEPQP